MRRAQKDLSRQQTVSDVCEIIKLPDGSFDIFQDGELIGRSIPDGWLEGELAKHGICGKEYRGARSKLNEVGEARLVFRTGRVKAKLRTRDDSTVELEGI